MHERIRAFVDSAARAFELKGPVCRIGFSGQGDLPERASLRECFSDAAYVGFDSGMPAATGRLPFPDGAARTVLCVGVLDGALRTQRVAAELARILSPGGALLVCALLEDSLPNRRPECWRPAPLTVERLMAGSRATVVGWQGGETFPHTIYGVGFKPPLAGHLVEGTRQFLEDFQARLDCQARQICWRRLGQLLTGWTRGRLWRQQRRNYHEIQFAVHLCVDEGLKRGLSRSCSMREATGSRLDLID